jgi:chromosome segregation ATPase
MLQSKQLELNNVSAELDSARTRLNDALAELNAKSSQIGHMEAANAETQHEIQRLKDHISKSTGLNSQLNSALHAAAKLEEQVKEKDLQLLQLQESKGEMEQEVQRINGELISLRAQTETASMSNADQENLSNEKQSQIVQLLQSCAEAKTEIKELNDQISELNEALIARDSAINSLEASVNEKKRQIEQFESEFGSKDQEAQCLARDLTNAQAQCRIAEAAKASLGAAMEEKESRIREYENALRTKNGEIAEIEKLLQKVTNDINNSEVKRTTAERRLDLKTRECHHKTQEIRKLLEDKQQLEQELMDAVLDKESFEKIIQESARRIELAIQTSMTDDMKKLADTGATKSESELYSESHTRPVSALNMQLRRLLRLFNHAQEQSAEQKYDNERLSREIYELNARKLEPLKQQNSALLAKEREWREQLIPSFERSIAQLESDLRKKQDIITRLQSTEQHLTEEVETMRLATEEKSQLAAVDLPAMKERVEWLEGQLCAKQAEVQRWKDANSILRDKIKGVTASSDRDASRILSEKAAMISYSTKQFKEVMLQRSSTQRSSADRPVPPAMDLTMVGERRISNPTSADPAPVDSVASTMRDTHNANHMSSQL